MKLRITTVCVLLALSLGFASCGPEENLPDAVLTSMSVSSSTYTVSADRIPGRISSDNYINYFDRDGYDYDYETVPFNMEGEGYTEEMRVRTTVSEGARAEWGVGGRSTKPTAFYATGVPIDFNANDYIYIRVTSEDAYVINYYRFYARIFSTVNELADLMVAGRYARMDTPGNTPQNAGNGQIDVTRLEAANALFAPATFDDNATVRYAIGKNPGDYTTPEDWAAIDYQPLEFTWVPDPEDPTKTIKNWLTRVPLVDYSWLYVEVTAQNTIDKLYYRYRVYTGRIATINKLEFVGTGNIAYDVVGKGTPGTGNTGFSTVGAGAFESPHQAANGFGIKIALDDPAGKYQYAKIASTSVNTEPTWLDPSNDHILFANNEALAIMVKPENDLGPAHYYKVKVSLLAADFLEHPKAKVYDVNDTAVPLTFTLDRDLPGATYQWYEANSWYGGYGFDADGNIFSVDAAFQGDPEQPQGTKEQNRYYVGRLDEKENVSFHNGGNEFYRLPVPGRPIPLAQGGTSQSYTPPTTKKPFIGKFSNVTNYYWVVVSAPGGLTATSQRAVIVTEHNEVWDLGVNKHESTTIDGVKKRHLVIDMPNLKNKAGARVPIKNPMAFTKFREPFAIDLRGVLPDGFDIMDYSMATAWARFYLKDGTPWIQNWTQGNISFVDWSENTSQDGSSSKLVLYYNLTNNNGTLGLAGDGKEPANSSLEDPFTHVVIMPSGEKPIRQMPPLNANGTPDASHGDAQGWFCGFIELVELRFEGEGPKRVKK